MKCKVIDYNRILIERQDLYLIGEECFADVKKDFDCQFQEALIFTREWIFKRHMPEWY